MDYVNSAPEIYLTLGRRDLANHLSCVRDAYSRLREKGYHFIYREFDELGDRTYHPPSNDDALAWATRLRNKNIAPSAEETKLLKAFSSAPPAPVDGYYPELALVGGAPAGAVLQKLFAFKRRQRARRRCGNVQARHFWRCNGCRTRKTHDRSFHQGAPVCGGRTRDVCQLALHTGAAGTNPSSPRIKGADPLDRLNAADAIGYAVRFQVKGVPQDPPLFQALVSLLQDKEEPVRSTAAGVLAPLYESGRRRPAADAALPMVAGRNG